MNESDEFDDKLMERAAALPKGVVPERDLWPGIEQAIGSPPAAPRPAWDTVWAKAASVLLLVGASSGLTWYWMKGQVQPVTQVSPALVFEQASFGANYSLGVDFQVARDGLAAELEVSLARLSPEARGDIEANLQIVQTAIYEINAALEQEPDNVLLQEKLLRAYREELMLLRRIGGLTRNVMMRNDI